jgi:homeodomain-containing protein/Homeodomain-like domain-containing protein
MPWPRARPVVLSDRERRVLERLARAGTPPQAVATRARVIGAAADGVSTRQIAQRLGLTRNTVQVGRDRWAAAAEVLLAAGAEGGPDDDRALEAVPEGLLAGAPRAGAPPTFTPEHLWRLMAIACEPPGDSGRPLSHWTPRELADEAAKRGLVERSSARTVGRVLVSGSGRAPAAPQPVLAHAPRRRSRPVRRRGAGHR